MRELDDYYNESQNTGLLDGGVVDETAGEVANDVMSTETLLGLIRARENDQLRRFGAQHLTAFARHASTASDVPFKHLFGLPVTRDPEELEDRSIAGSVDFCNRGPWFRRAGCSLAPSRTRRARTAYCERRPSQGACGLLQ
jgi:hypothetical protein